MIQCGPCGHTWFYKKEYQNQIKKNEIDTQNDIDISPSDLVDNDDLSEPIEKKERKLEKKRTVSKGSEIIKYKPKSNFTFAKFLSFLIVIIISFIAVIIILDTFKSFLFNIFPKLEVLLFSLYETLKDVKLFIKDLL